MNTATVTNQPVCHLLLWDAPNMDMTLYEVIGERPSPDTRPDFSAVARWLCERSSQDAVVEACVFANVAPENAGRMIPWVDAIRHAGFAVFAKPKLHQSDDIDDAIVAHARQRYDEGTLSELVLASHDGRAFSDLLRELAASRVSVVVLGFTERAGFAFQLDNVDLIDL